MELLGPKCRCDSFEAARARCPVLDMPVFARVPPRVWDGFFKKRTSNDYRKGNIIFYEGNRPFGMYFLCSGRVKIVKTDSGLHASIPRVREAPDLLGERAFLAGEPYSGSGEALEDCRICFIDGAYFEKLLLELPAVCRALLRRIAAELGKAEEHLLDLGYKTVRGRLAKYIVERAAAEPRAGKAAGEAAPASPAGKGGQQQAAASLKFPESRVDLAKILGTSPEVLCRLLAEFRRKGWISVSGRSITVKDRSRLEQVSLR